MQLFIKCGTRYKPAPRAIIKEIASGYLDSTITGELTSPPHMAEFLNARLSQLENENFGVLFLDNRHRVIDFKIMFTGTIDQSAVYPREVIKLALSVNAAAVVLAHNHPSGIPEPSSSDRSITDVLKKALQTVEIRLLDHFVIGRNSHVSFAERGYI